MPFSRSQNKEVLDRILRDVFEDGPEDTPGPIRQAIADAAAGITDIGALTSTDIEQLSYTNAAKETIPLKKYEIGLLKTLKGYIYHQAATGTPLDTMEDWDKCNLEAFNSFRVSTSWMVLSEAGLHHAPATAPPPTGGTTRTPMRDPVHDFKRGIKRDIGAYSDLKLDKGWDNWNRGLIAQARAQDLSEVLDSQYKPTDPIDVALFQEKQKFMYAVFEKHLQSDKGKALVRSYHKTADAQSVYKELADYAVNSTKASMGSRDLLTYITSSRLGDGKWKGGTHAYLLHWQDQLRRYHDLIDPKNHFSADVKRVMLENAVSQIPELRAVKVNADLARTQTGKPLTYLQYSALLASAAQQYDDQFVQSNSKPTKASRHVYVHDTDPDQYENIDDAFDIDMDVGTMVEAHATDFVRGPRLQRNQWDRLGKISADAQDTWDNLSNEAKKIILEPRRPRERTPRKPSTDVNLREISVHDYLQLYEHSTDPGSHSGSSLTDALRDQHDDSPKPGDCTSEHNPILAHLTKRATLPPGDIQRVLSSSLKRGEKVADETDGNTITVNGKTYRCINMARITYHTGIHRQVRRGALVDRGANGGIAGDDVRIIDKTSRQVDVQGIDNHRIVDIPIVTAGGVVKTQRGEAIAILNQYAYTGKGKTIHSSGQLEWFKQDVNEKSLKVSGGKQRIKTLDGYVIPINIHSGLPYITMRPYTDVEWETLPHIILTSPDEWVPSVLDHTLEDDEEWFDAVSDLPEMESLFDEFGEYRHMHIVQEHAISPTDLEEHIIPTKALILQDDNNSSTMGGREIDDREPDYHILRPNFGWQPIETIKRTFQNTTQYARMPMSTHLKKQFKSPNPVFNVPRHNEDVGTDTVYSDTPAIDSGETIAQYYVGRKSLVSDVYGMKTDKQFVNTLLDNIRRRGAPTRLLSDRAQVEISRKVQDVLRAFVIGDWQSEPHQQHQNIAERRYQDVKRMANTCMDRTGSPPHIWLLALTYVCYLLNFTASAALNWQTPMTILTGSTSDCSILLRFAWWDPVYFKVDDSDFPSESRELRGRFVGFSETVGHHMTYKILTDATQKVIHRGNVRSALDPAERNARLDPPDGETRSPTPIIRSTRDQDQENGEIGREPDGELPGTTDDTTPPQLTFIDPETLIGRTFLTTPQEDGQRFRARILRAIEDHEKDLDDDPARIKFLCSMNNDAFEEIVSYNDIVHFLERDELEDNVWKFKRITAHEGPLNKRHPSWKGSPFNVMVEWEDGSITAEPLGIIAKDDPVSCAIYAKANGLLDTDGWKRFRTIAKRQKKFVRMGNQAKLRSFRTAPRFKYGFEVPRDYQHAKRLDERNGNTKWQDSTALEFKQLDEYDTFLDRGPDGKPPGPGYKRIKVHLVFDVKHDGRHKARCVADGHLTDVPVDSVYSGVVTLRGLRMMIFLAELNQLETWATDIGNAYLEAKTSEKLYIIAGPEFGEREGHMLVIFKALYGLRTSGLRWHERFSIVLRKLGFEPCKAEPDIWLRRNGDVYEYVGVYVDDLAMAMKDPQEFVDVLTKEYKFKLKGTGPISFHLGCDFFRDEEGTLCMAPRQYIDKMISNYERMFGERPKTNVYSPLEKGDHPEIDESDLLEPDDVTKYQSIVGSLQWAISLGRFDIATAVMTLSSFRAVPRQGHLERAKRVVGYLSKMRHGMIRFRTGEPDYSDLPTRVYDWAHSVYGHVTEQLPSDAPTPLGRYVTLTHYVDANLFHCLITGRSVTGILHLANQTPFDWFTKKQATVETATYGSEFVAARVCTEQIIDIRTTFRYLGVPIRDQSYMFGDNESVVNSSSNMSSKLHKRHTALSYHRVREAIAAGMVVFHHISGPRNPADILSKHWSYSSVWKIMQPLLFWQGDTASIGGKDDQTTWKDLEAPTHPVSTKEAPNLGARDRELKDEATVITPARCKAANPDANQQ